MAVGVDRSLAAPLVGPRAFDLQTGRSSESGTSLISPVLEAGEDQQILKPILASLLERMCLYPLVVL